MALKRSSTAIDDRNWCYDEPDGLQIVHQVVSESGAVDLTATAKLRSKA